jgi:hypothetical protein
MAMPEALAKTYAGWTGRLATSALLHVAFRTVDLPRAHVLSTALALLVVVVSWLIARTFVLRAGALRTSLAAFALAAVSLGLFRLLHQTVFWPTGGIVYLVPLALLLLWIGAIRRLVLRRDPGWGAAAGFGFGALVGNAIELALPVAAVYAAAMLVPAWPGLARDLRRVAAWRLAGLGIGAAVLLGAPGNLRRAEVTPDSFNFSPDVVVPALVRMVTEIVQAGAPMLAIAALVATASAFALRVGHPAGVEADAPRGMAVREAAALAAGGLLSIMPVLSVPAQFAPRNGLFVLVGLFLAALALAVPVLVRWRAAPAGLALAAAIGALVATGVFGGEVVMARDLRAVQLAQDRALREAAARGDRDAVVTSWGVPVPRTIHAIELAHDPARWDNRCVARYHGLATVRRARDGR